MSIMDELTINKEFAEHYDKYRRAEELQKLKETYGSDAEDDSSSESEDEFAEALNPKLEKQFFHLLAKVKAKDPVLYNKDEKFFSDHSSSSETDSEDEDNSAKKEKPLYPRQHEAKVALEKNGVYDDVDEEEVTEEHAPDSYIGELAAIKKSFTEAAKEHDQQFEDDDGVDSLLKTKKVATYGDNRETKLQDLDDYWKDPKLNEKEKYLRDYILEKKYIDSDSESELPVKNEDLEEDKQFSDKQEMFEYKYNTRYEQPDHDFIKSYPRIIASSVRRKDERKKNQRLQREKRKNEEKRKKAEELARLKRLKREEIMEKISRLQEASGNTDIQFADCDIDDDFDPDQYDKRMQEIFNDEFYAEDEDEKPQFSDIGEDEFGEETNWDQYDDQGYDQDYADYNDEIPECEQPDFVMDCDYVPEVKKKSKKQLKKERYGLSEAQFLKEVAKCKAKLDEKSTTEHLEEYFSMDYDDLIGDMPCRFKYRNVEPNSFGLSTEDILLADNRTLNIWCPLKRVVCHRLPEDEFYLRQKYARRARSKKEKTFKKFYDDLENKKTTKKQQNSDKKEEKLENKPQGRDEKETTQQNDVEKSNVKRKKLSSRQRKRKRLREQQLEDLGLKSGQNCKKRFKKHLDDDLKRLSQIKSSRLEAYGLKPKKFMKTATYISIQKKKKKNEKPPRRNVE